MVVTEPPFRSVVPGASVVRVDSARTLPTAPLKLVVPLSFTVSERFAPEESTVPLNVTPTPVIVVLAPRVTASP